MNDSHGVANRTKSSIPHPFPATTDSIAHERCRPKVVLVSASVADRYAIAIDLADIPDSGAESGRFAAPVADACEDRQGGFGGRESPKRRESDSGGDDRMRSEPEDRPRKPRRRRSEKQRHAGHPPARIPNPRIPGRQAGRCAQGAGHPLLRIRMGGGQGDRQSARCPVRRVRPGAGIEGRPRRWDRDVEAILASLAPLLERTFRYASMLATLRRDDVDGAGRMHPCPMKRYRPLPVLSLVAVCRPSLLDARR